MAYTVLARRYRSASFDELIGQQPIARTLRAAIDQDRVAHAYLFTGTRGVGKTSSARLFADALNNPEGDQQIHQAIMASEDVDVIEIDAASNSGVENVRDLISNAVYAPMRGRYKVYIIDEVHMLSNAAFNALLKTMEEPEDHVKFILCTTEAHKVPPTIQSRCQRFDFRNIPVELIAEHLAGVVKQEALKADEDLLYAVARLGNGSMRDALSLLDRVIAAGESKLTLRLLEDLLGLPRRDLVSALLDAFTQGEPKPALEAAAELMSTGSGYDEIISTLLERLRDLMVLAACGPETELVELTGETRRDEVERAQRFDAAGIVHMIAVCESVQRQLGQSPAPRALFDALIVRLTLTDKLADVTAIASGARGLSQAAGPKA